MIKTEEGENTNCAEEIKKAEEPPRVKKNINLTNSDTPGRDNGKI